MILFNDLKKKYLYLQKEIDNACKKVLRSGRYILEKETEGFEKKFAQYLGAKYCAGVGNGLEALQIALMALNIKEGDEVITTPYSMAASTLAIKMVGAIPVFVDIDNYFHIDADKIEEKITSRTKAILPVHLFGQMAEMEKIKKIAKRHNLFLVEDAAQAHGARYKDKKAGTFGDIGCFSFYPTKNLGTFGDGGAIVTNNKKLYEKCKMIRNYGQKNRYEHELCGLNSRLDEIHAAILSVDLKYLNKFNLIRKNLAKIYSLKLKNIKEIKLPEIRIHADHIFHAFTIEVERRQDLISFLAKNKIPTFIYYPIPIHKQKCFSGFNHLDFPITEKKSKKVLSLPIHPFLESKDIAYISQKIAKFYEV
ncbi:MAG: DegT/DnrJ/EryC1/StrS family aminotransferase [Candidatus Pacebacteria bacterium]|nr:DegT/DnrJ/EryC1/StrS family aminotransferase [Candidatus Paceibacterota bacterium]